MKRIAHGIADAMRSRADRYARLAADARADESLARTGRIVALMFIAVGVGDALSTSWAISHGAYEINGAMRWLQDNLGFFWFVPKALAHALVATMIIWSPNRATLSIMAVVTVWTAMVVANNLHIATILSGLATGA